jgi:hypothetical protein
MNRFRAVWLVLTVTLAAVPGRVAHAAGPVGNGDVNADGRIDVSDAVYLQSNLFLGGPALKPIECPPPTGGLPATGQSKCYDFMEGQGCPRLLRELELRRPRRLAAAKCVGA